MKRHTSAKETETLVTALKELAYSHDHEAKHANEDIVPAGERKCPICQKPMTCMRKLGVTIDVCQDHGVWLDQGELAYLLNAAYHYEKELELRPDAASGLNLSHSQDSLDTMVKTVAEHLGKTV